ncbi:hypothetical protein BHE74_00043147 [Ensete ventricosum]|nr:hypothetical protein BHE74_00043147 [Ensete ventricosum]RZS09301.1 hypothetical protein BHM03_00040375 [Ensete ventricosum]
MAMASPLAGAAGCSQGPTTSGRLIVARGWPTAARGRCSHAARPYGQPPEGGQLQRSARKGRQPPAAMPQGLPPMVSRWPLAASSQGAADCGFDARRKAACGQRHRPQGLPPAEAAPAGATPMEVSAAGVAAGRQGQPSPAQGQQRRWRRSEGEGGLGKLF